MLPLPTAQEGEVIEIKKITGNDATRLHLAEMGFTVGSKITVVTRLGCAIPAWHWTNPWHGGSCTKQLFKPVSTI